MHLLLFALAVLAGGCLLARARRRRAFVEVAPRHRSFLRRLKLTEAEDFLALPAVIVSGHPDRHVARLTLGVGAEARTVYLKREHRVPWSVRLAGALAGFGLVSRSLREARTLQALQREGIDCPEWLAAGEDGRGRAFLLLAEVPGGEDLGAFLRRECDPEVRRRVARGLGAAVARLH